jgi:hypothetical protein
MNIHYSLTELDIKKAIADYVRKHGTVKDDEDVQVTFTVTPADRPGDSDQISATARPQRRVMMSTKD